MMLPPDVLRDFHSLYGVEKFKLDQQLSADIGSLVARYAANGILLGSAAANGILAAAIDSIPMRGQLKLNLVLRTLGAYGVQVTREIAADAADLIAKHLDDEVEQLLHKINDTPPYKRPGLVPDPRIAVSHGAEMEKTRVRSELSLVAAASTRTADAGSGSVINVHGPVGVIQTGPGSYAVSNQTVDSAASAALMKAFATIESLLDHDAPETADIRELMEDGKAELAKPKQNMARIRGVLSGLGGAISYAPKLKAAYDTLKWAATFFGINLP